MALDFPSSPTNNQVYENYIYNSTSGAWQKLPGNTFATTAISDTPPVNPSDGNLWWSNDEETGNTLKLYNGSSFVNAAPISNNAIINGDFGVWQRGTSFPSGSTTEYTADRWQKNFGVNSSVSRQSFTPADVEVVGYGDAEFFLRFTMDTADTPLIEQKIEDVRTFAGQTVTLSFWAKADSEVSYLAQIRQQFGSGGSADVSLSNTVEVGTSWSRIVTTFTLGSLSGKTIGSGSALNVRPITDPGAGAEVIDIWGVQLEAGSVATPFLLAGGGSKSAELALCQRYYQETARSNSSISPGFFPTTTIARVTVPLVVSMRDTPTITGFNDIKSSGSSVSTTVDSIGLVNDNSKLTVFYTGTGFTANETCVEIDGGTLDAEL